VRVSLQGTFDTLSVTELFGLLATASKTGALRLEAGDHEAAVYVNAGRCCGVESDDASGPAATDEDLARLLVDTGFTVARQAAGSFRFSDAEEPPFAADVTTRFEPAVVEITEMLAQWREIEATIPSLDVRLRLAPVLRGEEIVLSAREWSLLVALDGMPSVRELVARRHEPVIQVCRVVKDLSERGAIDIGTDLARPEHQRPEHQRPEAQVASPARAEAEAGVEVAPDPPTEISPGRGRRGREAASAGHLAPSEPYAPSSVPSASPRSGSTPARSAATASGRDAEAPAARTGVAAVSAAADAVAAAEADAARESATEAARGDSGGDGSQDRGALLRLFSALKE
jgi:hypothetical protein